MRHKIRVNGIMAVKIRLQRHGRSKRPFYHIVVADSKARRDGKFIDRIGDYNPLTIPATINLNFDRAYKWIMEGAEPTDTCARILGYKGVLFKKHLTRGVLKGAFSQEEADKKFAAWLEEKTQKIDPVNTRGQKKLNFYQSILKIITILKPIFLVLSRVRFFMAVSYRKGRYTHL